MSVKNESPMPRTVGTVGAKGENDDVSSKQVFDFEGIKTSDAIVHEYRCKTCGKLYLDQFGPFGDLCPCCADQQWNRIYHATVDDKGRRQG